MPQRTRPYTGNLEDFEVVEDDEYEAVPEEQPPPAQAGAVSRFATGVGETALPTDRLSDVVEGPLYAARHPIESLKLLGQSLKEAHGYTAGKAAEKFRQGSIAEGLGYTAATALPFVGPAAARAGETIAEGDVARGLGQATGILAPFGAGAATAAAKSTARAALPSRAANVQQITKALGATTNEMKARAARVAPRMLDEGVRATSLEKLEQQAAAKSAQAGSAVGEELAKHANKQRDVLPLVDELEKAKASHVDTNAAGKRVVINEGPVREIQALQDTLMEYGDTISVESLNKVRKGWDEVVQAGKGFTTPDLGTKWKTWAARNGRTALREELSRADTNIDRVMSEYSFWQNIEDIAHATNRRRVGQQRNLVPTIAGGAGAIVGGAAGAGGAFLGAQLFASLRALVDSPGWNMVSPIVKQRLADALASGNKERIATAIGRGVAASPKDVTATSVRAPATTTVEERRENRPPTTQRR